MLSAGIMIKAVRLPSSYVRKQVITYLASEECCLNSVSTAQGSLALLSPSRTFSTKVDIGEDACPQGIQGDDCDMFKLWTESCRRYGLSNCDEQLQGIQTGRKTLAEVFKEQDELISNIAAQYKVKAAERYESIEGVQDNISAFPKIDSPCPQGVQGDDCARFKLWLENCHRFGFQDCMQQYTSFKAGRKTLAQIFDEQDAVIRSVVNNFQKRPYSTSTNTGRQRPEGDPPISAGQTHSQANPKTAATPGGDATTLGQEGEHTVKVEEGQLSQRQRLQRAVKEYGSTWY